MISGPTGTGKTLNADIVSKNLDKTKFAAMTITFSAQTTVNSVQDNMDSKFVRRKFGVYGPEAQKKMSIFVDDLNMPKKEF